MKPRKKTLTLLYCGALCVRLPSMRWRFTETASSRLARIGIKTDYWFAVHNKEGQSNLRMKPRKKTLTLFIAARSARFSDDDKLAAHLRMFN